MTATDKMDKGVGRAGTPWRIEQPEAWPFNVNIVTASGTVILSEGRPAYGSGDKSVADVLRGNSFDDGDRREAARHNAAQIEKLELIVQAVNSHEELKGALGKIWSQIEDAEFENIEDNDDCVLITINAEQARSIRAALTSEDGK